MNKIFCYCYCFAIYRIKFKWYFYRNFSIITMTSLDITNLESNDYIDAYNVHFYWHVRMNLSCILSFYLHSFDKNSIYCLLRTICITSNTWCGLEFGISCHFIQPICLQIAHKLFILTNNWIGNISWYRIVSFFFNSQYVFFLKMVWNVIKFIEIWCELEHK